MKKSFLKGANRCVQIDVNPCDSLRLVAFRRHSKPFVFALSLSLAAAAGCTDLTSSESFSQVEDEEALEQAAKSEAQKKSIERTQSLLAAAGFSGEEASYIVKEIGSELLPELDDQKSIDPETARKLSASIYSSLTQESAELQSSNRSILDGLLYLVGGLQKEGSKDELDKVNEGLGRGFVQAGLVQLSSDSANGAATEASSEQSQKLIGNLLSDIAVSLDSSSTSALSGALVELVGSQVKGKAEIVSVVFEKRVQTLLNSGVDKDFAVSNVEDILEAASASQTENSSTKSKAESEADANDLVSGFVSFLETTTAIDEKSKELVYESKGSTSKLANRLLEKRTEFAENAAQSEGSSSSSSNQGGTENSVESVKELAVDPSSLSIVEVSESSAAFAFAKQTEASATQVYNYRLQSGGESVGQGSCNASLSQQELESGSFALSGLLPFTAYELRLCGFNSLAETSTSPGLVLNFQTPDKSPESFANLALGAVDKSSANVTWSAFASSPVQMKVAIGSASSTNEICLTGELIDSEATTHTFTSLSPDTSYKAHFCTFNRDITTAITERVSHSSVSFTTQKIAYDPSAVTAVSIEETETTIGFTAAAQAGASPSLSYVLTPQSSPSVASSCDTAITPSEVASGQILLSSLAPFTAYQIRVCGVESEAEIVNSAGQIVDFQTLDTNPEAIGNLSIGLVGDTSAKLTWSAFGEAPADLKVHLGDATSLASSCLNGTSIDASLEEHTFGSILPGTSYKAHFCTFNRDIATASTPKVQFESIAFDTIDSLPDDPASLVVNTRSANDLTVGFSASPTATGGYRVSILEGGTPPADCSTISQTLSEGSTSVSVSALTMGTDYSFRICAVNTNTPIEVSTGDSATGTFKTLYDLPGEVAAFTATPVSATRIDFAWTKGSGTALGHVVVLAPGATAPADCMVTTGVTRYESSSIGMSESLSVGGLQPNSTHSARLCAVNADGAYSTGLTQTATTQGSSDSSGACAEVGGIDSICTVNTGSFADGFLLSGAGNVTIPSGETLTVSGDGKIDISGTLTIAGNLVGNFSRISASQITIEASASLNADGKGFAGGSGHANGAGPGGGIKAYSTSSSYPASGAGHAGKGGNSGNISTVVGGTHYSHSSSKLGSGGGGRGSEVGGAGGGHIQLESFSSLAINGSISAKGNTGSNSTSSGAAGGGSGGTIELIAQSLSGTGSVSVQGGNGGVATSAADRDGGAGAGGYIIAEFATSTFSGNLLAEGGVGQDTSTDGGTGIIVEKTNGETTYIYESINTEAKGWSVFDPDLHNDATQISSKGESKVLIEGASDVELSGSFKLKDNSWFRRSSTLNVSADSLLVEENAKLEGNLTLNLRSGQVAGTLSSDGLGHAGGSGDSVAGTGPGGGSKSYSTSSSYGGGGGAHVGAGGRSAGSGSFVASASAGYSQADSKLGSGGGSSGASRAGGAGGGLLIVNASEQFEVTGTLSSVGAVGVGHTTGGSGGGGAGGTVEISAPSFSGDGTLTVRGGNGGSSTSNTTSDGGAGGGGYLSVTSANNTFSGQKIIEGGTGQDTAYDGGTGAYVEVNGETTSLVYNSIQSQNREITTATPEFLSSANNLTLLGESIVRVTGTDPVAIENQLSLQGNSRLFRSSEELGLTVNSLVVEAGATLEGLLDIDSTSISLAGTLSSKGYGFAGGVYRSAKTHKVLEAVQARTRQVPATQELVAVTSAKVAIQQLTVE